jgi:hypothetical protein
VHSFSYCLCSINNLLEISTKLSFQI